MTPDAPRVVHDRGHAIRTAYGYGPMDLEFMNTSEERSRTARGMRLDAVYGLGERTANESGEARTGYGQTDTPSRPLRTRQQTLRR